MVSRRISDVSLLIRDVLLVALGKYGQFLVTLVTIPFIARSLGPSLLGTMSIGLGTYFVGSLLVDLGLSQVLGSEASQGGDIGFLRGSYALARLMVLLTIVVLAIVGLSIHSGGVSLDCAAIGLLAGAISSCGEDWLFYGQGRFVVSLICQGAGRLGYLVALLILLPQISDPRTALACLGFGSILSAGLSWFVASKGADQLTWRWLEREKIRLAGPIFLSRIATVFYGPASLSFYGPFVNSTIALGHYAAGERVVRVGQAGLDSFGVVMLSRVAKGNVSVRATAWSGIALAAALGSFACCALYLAAPIVTQLLYGEEYSDSVLVMRLLCLILPATSVTTFVVYAFLPAFRDSKGIFIIGLGGALVAAAGICATQIVGTVAPVIGGVILSEWAAATLAIFRAMSIVSHETIGTNVSRGR